MKTTYRFEISCSDCRRAAIRAARRQGIKFARSGNVLVAYNQHAARMLALFDAHFRWVDDGYQEGEFLCYSWHTCVGLSGSVSVGGPRPALAGTG